VFPVAADFRFFGGMSPSADLDRLSTAELKTPVLQLLGDVSTLRQVVAEQREEIARLKGLKGPPSIKPSGIGVRLSSADPHPGREVRGWRP
jgi:hypothetical protein